MDYIFKEWENRLSDFADSVEKDLAEIRKCKANIQQMQLDITAEIQKVAATSSKEALRSSFVVRRSAYKAQEKPDRWNFVPPVSMRLQRTQVPTVMSTS